MGITFGQQIACIVQFVVIMTLLSPMVGATLANGNGMITNAAYLKLYGVNGIVNNTATNFNTQLLVPLVTQANSTAGFGASGSLQQFSGLAFIYGAMNLAWKSFTNFPTMLYLIFTGVWSNISFLPTAIASIASIGIIGYVLISDFFNVLSAWMKTDLSNVGA